MAKVGKTNAGSVTADAPQIKSRGLKNPVPQKYDLEVGQPEMAMDNDGDGTKPKTPPKSGKRAPGKMNEDA